jgi:hypothetical protein
VYGLDLDLCSERAVTRARLAAFAFAVLVAAGAAWFYFNFERVTEREHVGYQGEARENPLLAATRLYERMGKKTRTIKRPLQLAGLPSRGTLLLSRFRSGMSTPTIERLMGWVKSGGHLIVAAAWHSNPDPILDRLEIERSETSGRSRRSDASIVKLPHAPHEMKIVLGNRLELREGSVRALHRIEDRAGTILLHYDYGAGRVTVLNSMSFMTNAAIGQHDHAEFAWQLLGFNPASREIAMAFRIETPPLMTALAENAWQALVAAGLLLAAWLWHVIPRFGPLIPDPLPVRRRLLDHLRASGLFHWKHGDIGRLTMAARESCMHRIARTHPVIAALPVPQRAARFAQITGLPEDDIVAALTARPADPPQLTGVIRTLQTLEERLTRRMAQ